MRETECYKVVTVWEAAKFGYHKIRRRSVCCLHFVDWWQISFGVSVDFRSPNFELHLPFCFFKVGWEVDIVRRRREDK